ncbi:hypothetical protein K4F52_006059 [Lecanicillium sp. MT-2017a]|nr:hypothetical protein K4F52_006059 [Lecanicillium sp. MT-2017a]
MFHPFPQLPPELRREIWSLATRDFSVPGVHFFAIKAFDQTGDLPDEITFTSPGCSVRCKKGGYPKATLSGYWEHANVSSYLEDSGLWTACRESRDVMQHQAKPIRQRCKSYYNKDGSLEHTLLDHLPVTGLFEDAQLTTPRLFTVYPDRDLFVIGSEWLDRLPYLTETQVIIGADEWALRAFPNIAIEYDPAWGKDFRDREYFDETTDEMLSLVQLGLEGCWDHLYLIDYQIKCDKAVRKWEAETGKSATAFATRKGRFICVSDGRKLKNDDGALSDAVADDHDDCDECCKCRECAHHLRGDDTRNGTLQRGENPYCSYFFNSLKDEIQVTAMSRYAEVDVLAWLPW